MTMMMDSMVKGRKLYTWVHGWVWAGISQQVRIAVVDCIWCSPKTVPFGEIVPVDREITGSTSLGKWLAMSRESLSVSSTQVRRYTGLFMVLPPRISSIEVIHSSLRARSGSEGGRRARRRG
jgi:hypothetical protein